MKALFPSQCPVCHNPIQRGMEIEDSGMRGPRGGKKMAHVECLGGTRRNPRRTRRNPHSASREVDAASEIAKLPGVKFVGEVKPARSRTHRFAVFEEESGEAFSRDRGYRAPWRRREPSDSPGYYVVDGHRKQFFVYLPSRTKLSLDKVAAAISTAASRRRNRVQYWRAGEPFHEVGDDFLVDYPLLRNPRVNAGRRTFRGEPKAGRPSRFADYEADENYLFDFGSKDLARMGTPEALDELERRERGPDGVKLAWKR